MTTHVEDQRFTLTDEDGDRLIVRPPGPKSDVFRVKIKPVVGAGGLVLATADEMRALRDYLDTMLP